MGGGETFLCNSLYTGSFATASCCHCKYRVDCDAIREDIMNQVYTDIVHCTQEEATLYFYHLLVSHSML